LFDLFDLCLVVALRSRRCLLAARAWRAIPTLASEGIPTPKLAEPIAALSPRKFVARLMGMGPHPTALGANICAVS